MLGFISSNKAALRENRKPLKSLQMKTIYQPINVSIKTTNIIFKHWKHQCQNYSCNGKYC